MAKAKSAPGLDPERSLLANAALTIGERLDAMLAYEPTLGDPKAVYALHEMRIAAERLRYTLEIFQDIYTDYTPYGKPFAEAVESVRTLQEHLGEIHDADVLVPQLIEYMAHLLRDGYGENRRGEPRAGVHYVDFDACQGLITLCRQSRDDRDRRYAQLLQDWNRLREQKAFENLRALLQDAETAPPPTLEKDGTGPEGDAETPPAPTAARPAPRRARRRPDDHEHRT